MGKFNARLLKNLDIKNLLNFFFFLFIQFLWNFWTFGVDIIWWASNLILNIFVHLTCFQDLVPIKWPIVYLVQNSYCSSNFYEIVRVYRKTNYSFYFERSSIYLTFAKAIQIGNGISRCQMFGHIKTEINKSCVIHSKITT